MIADLTSNQYYGGLNRRFDRRVRLLHKLGFKRIANEFGAFYAKPFRRFSLQKRYIPAAVLSHAQDRAFYEQVRYSL